jgi:hypothetical protein
MHSINIILVILLLYLHIKRTYLILKLELKDEEDFIIFLYAIQPYKSIKYILPYYKGNSSQNITIKNLLNIQISIFIFLIVINFIFTIVNFLY